MQLKGTTWDLTGGSVVLDFQEVRENPAIYYIAGFRFFNEEWRHFEVHFRPEGSDQTLTLKIKHQMYQDLENVVRGVRSSKVVSWFIRNRRKKGEKVAAREAEEAAAAQAREEALAEGSGP